MADREIPEQFLEPVTAAVPVRHRHFEHGEDVLLDRQAAEDRHLLRQVADPELRAPEHRQRRSVAPVDQHPSRVGHDQPGDAVEAGRLARTVRPEQRHHLAPRQPQRHVADHRLVAIGLAQPLDVEPVLPLVAGRHPRARLHGGRSARLRVPRRQRRALHQLPPGCRTERTRPATFAVPSVRLTSIRSPASTLWPWVTMALPVSTMLPEGTS